MYDYQENVLTSAFNGFHQNYVYSHKEILFTGFISYTSPYQNPFYTILECEPLKCEYSQYRNDTSLTHKMNIKSVMHLCLDPAYTNFLRSERAKTLISMHFSNISNAEVSVLELYKLPQLLNIQDLTSFAIIGRRDHTAYFNIIHKNIILNCKTDPFNFCKNKLTSTISTIKEHINNINSSDINNYFNTIDIFTGYCKHNIEIAESSLSKLNQISRYKLTKQPISNNDVDLIYNLILAINKTRPEVKNKINFEYKVTVKGMVLAIGAWDRKDLNRIILPGIKKKLHLDEHIENFVRFLYVTDSFNSTISKLESIKLLNI